MRYLLLVALVVATLALPAEPARADSAIILPTIADTAGVLLTVPLDGRTIRINSVLLFYDEDVTPNQVYAGIVRANAAHTRELWLGQLSVASAAGTLSWPSIRLRLAGSVAQGGVRLFLSGVTDTLSGVVDYDVINE